MCNRYRLRAGEQHLAARYGLDTSETGRLPPVADELFPKRLAAVVRQEAGERQLDAMVWGFPHQVKGASGKMIEKPVTNVRNLASPFWRSALADPERRCLVPFMSFSEYGQVRGEGGKLPLHWVRVPSRPIVSFAGIWRPLPGGERAFAFLTCEPNSVVGPIHPKAMPVLLHDEDEERWLTADMGTALELAAPFPAQLMTVDDGSSG